MQLDPGSDHAWLQRLKYVLDLSSPLPAATAPLTRYHLTSAMQTPAASAAAAAAAARPPHRGYVACLSAALAALLGHAAGAELYEDELLDGLKEAGLITYPPPPLGPPLGPLIGRLLVWVLGWLRQLLPWWLLLRVQGALPPHRLRLSGALARKLAGPHSPNTQFPFFSSSPCLLVTSCSLAWPLFR